MDKASLEKLAFDYPNDFDFGGVVRQLLHTDETAQEEITKDENTQEDVDSKWKDAYARLAADFDNFRKRSLKEREELISKTKVAMLEPILDMDSDISLAIESTKDDESREGMRLIINKLSKFLALHGIESVQTEKYDSEQHEVISILNEGGNEIHAVISKGYSLNGKIIRFPKVILK